MLVWLVVGVIAWIVCGLIAAGWQFAYWQGKYAVCAAERYSEDLRFSLSICLAFGPIALVMEWFQSEHGQYGWRLR